MVLLTATVAASCRLPVPASRATPSAHARKVLLVSLDGFRSDYIQRPAAVRLRALAAAGVRAERLVPSFPSKTFPNHYTLVTGLYPEHHGIIANVMFDTTLNQRFAIADTAVTHDPRWWGGEPLWTTVERQGKKAASFFWVGSDIPIGGHQPTWYRTYDARVADSERVQTVLSWLAMPEGRGPSLVLAYFNAADDAGHAHGPSSPQVDTAIAHLDSVVGALVDGLAARGLSNQVDVVIVSDHGMAPIAADRVIYYDDYIDLSTVTLVDQSPVGALVPVAGRGAEVYAKLKGAHPHMQVYWKNETPARLHFRNNTRITPLVTIADEGWTMTTRASVAKNGLPHGGTHGYDNQLPSMGALFVAAGPDFQQGMVVPPFQNVHVYPLLASLLGVKPAPNDGSLDSTRAVLRQTAAH